eukprot:4471029-Amphidinium_carterae.1
MSCLEAAVACASGLNISRNACIVKFIELCLASTSNERTFRQGPFVKLLYCLNILVCLVTRGKLSPRRCCNISACCFFSTSNFLRSACARAVNNAQWPSGVRTFHTALCAL